MKTGKTLLILFSICTLAFSSSPEKSIGVAPIIVDADLSARWSESDEGFGDGITRKLTSEIGSSRGWRQDH